MWNKTSTVCIMLAIVIVLVLILGCKILKSTKTQVTAADEKKQPIEKKEKADEPEAASFRGRK